MTNQTFRPRFFPIRVLSIFFAGLFIALVVAYYTGAFTFPHTAEAMAQFFESTGQMDFFISWTTWMKGYIRVFAAEPAFPRLSDLLILADIILGYLLFVFWLQKANQNLVVLCRTGKRFNGWKIWLFSLTPILSLWAVPKILQEIWKGSTADRDDLEWRKSQVSGLALVWGMIHAMITLGVSFLIIAIACNLDISMMTGTLASLALLFLGVLAVILIFAVMLQTNNRQYKMLEILDSDN